MAAISFQRSGEPSRSEAIDQRVSRGTTTWVPGSRPTDPSTPVFRAVGSVTAGGPTKARGADRGAHSGGPSGTRRSSSTASEVRRPAPATPWTLLASSTSSIPRLVPADAVNGGRTSHGSTSSMTRSVVFGALVVDEATGEDAVIA